MERKLQYIIKSSHSFYTTNKILTFYIFLSHFEINQLMEWQNVFKISDKKFIV